MLKNKYGFLLLRTTLLALFFMFGFINNVFASVNGIEKVVFYAIPNSFVVGEISKVISIKAQDSSGNNQLFDDADGLLELSTDSPTGSFYSNTSATNPINTLSINNKTYSGRNFYYRDSSEGNFVITVKLSIVPDNGKSWTATQDITVTNSSGGGESNTAVLTGISVTNPPTKTIYGIGDSLNISGMVVAGTYDNGSTSTVPVVVSDISGFDSSTSTIDQILTILYKEKTATFSVSISSSTVADIPPTTIITKIVNHHSTHYLSEDLSDYVEEESFKVSAGRERIAYVGTPINFTAKNNKDGKNLDFKWSFGDATENKGNEISHVYKYPGEYIVVLNAQYNGEKAVSRTSVKVLEPKIMLSINQNSLEITNNGDDEINIGDWKIKGSQSEFLIPRDTIISSKNKVILSLGDIGFVSESFSSIRIEDQSINTIAFSQDFIDSSIKKDNNDQSIVLKNNYELEKILGMKVKDAEKMVADQRLKLAKTTPKEQPASDDTSFEKSISNNNQIENDQRADKKFMMATVNETLESTTSVGFWERVGKFPINSIKYIGSMFYDL